MTAVYHEGEIVAYAWATTGEAPISQRLSAGGNANDRYSYKSYTVPSHRGKRLSTIASLYSDLEFRARGCTHAVSYTDAHNFESIRTEASKGNILVGWAGYLEAFGHTFTFRTPGAIAAGFQLRVTDA